MSGRDEPFVPSEPTGAEHSPHPPTTAPPSFGQSAPADSPRIVFKTPGSSGAPDARPPSADAPPGAWTISGPPMAPEAEETMTPPPDPHVPDAEKTMTAPPPYDPASGPQGIPYAAMPPHPDQVLGEAERTVTDVHMSGPHMPGPQMSGPYMSGTTGTETLAPDAEKTMAVARFAPGPHLSFGTSQPTSGPALTPDAILPPGIAPQAPPEPPNDLGATSTGPIPRLGAGPGFPGGPDVPYGGPHAGHPDGPSAPSRALLAGGALLGVLILGGAGVLGYTELSGSAPAHHKPTPPPSPVAVTPTPTPSKTKAKHKPKPPPVDIRDEKSDPKPLTIGEVFPSHRIRLAGRTFVMTKSVINDHCSLAANRPFADELTRQHCRRIVRATFVSTDKKVAVTAGVAVMPTDAAASAVLKVQDPAHYRWFRGLTAPGAPKIDHAGGYASSTRRGRYIPYAYATYVSGHKYAKGDKILKPLAGDFRVYATRPIDRRAKHH